MNIACCYRCVPGGEVIHTYIDSESGICQYMPETFYDTKNLPLAIYNPASYNGLDVDWMAMCEALLLCNDDNCLVIETTIGYKVLQWNGWWAFVDSTFDTMERGKCIVRPNPNNFTYIGYRPTKLIQFRACRGIYRLTYDLVNKNIVTNEGIFTPAFDVDSLSEIDFHYAGYKDTVNNNYFAVVYRNNEPVFLERVGSQLVEVQR